MSRFETRKILFPELLKAVRKMDYVLFWDGCDDYHALSVFDGGKTLRDPAGVFIRGGDIDGCGLASCHVWGGTVPPKGMDFKAWSDYYASVKKLDQSGKFDAAAERALLAKGLPEMLADSVAFDIWAGNSVFDGCFADTAVIGFKVSNNTMLTNCGFYNNPRMGLRKSTAWPNSQIVSRHLEHPRVFPRGRRPWHGTFV